MKPISRMHQTWAGHAAWLAATLVFAGCGGSSRESAAAPAADTSAGAEAPTVQSTSPTQVERQDATEESGIPVRGAAEPGESAWGGERQDAWPAAAANATQELVGLDEQLLEAMTLSAPDCDFARSLRDRICDLSERICGIATNHPSDAPTLARCADGRDRCARARADVGESCGD